jgi:hypothetical protein
MKIRTFGLFAGLLAFSGNLLAADAPAKAPRYKFEKVAHLSCKQAWYEADKSVDKAFAMIEAMTVYLLKQRQVQFPNDRDAGSEFGKAIDTRCKADPDQLMLAAVDAALRQVVQP